MATGEITDRLEEDYGNLNFFFIQKIFFLPPQCKILHGSESSMDNFILGVYKVHLSAH